MTDKELLQLFKNPEDEKEFIKFNFGDGKKQIMEKIIQTTQFKEFFPRMIEQTDEYWCYHGDEIEVAIGSRLSWLSYLSEQKEPYDIKYAVGETNFPMHAYSFSFDNKKYWLITIIGQGAISWVVSEDEFFETYIIEFPNVVKTDKQGGCINTECMPVTEFVTRCIICGNSVVVGMWDSAPKVCEDCKKAIAYAKKLMEKDNER